MDELRSILSEYSFEPWNRFTAGLIAALFVARGLDFLSTWIVTPTLKLEANPLMRRVSWLRMIVLNLPLLGLPFLHHGLAITFIVTSLLVAGGNLSGGALSRGMGEGRQLQRQQEALRRIGLVGALGMNTAGMLVVGIGGLFLMALTGGESDRVWWGGLGVVMYGVSGLVHFNWAILRLHRAGRRSGQNPARP